MKFDLKYPYASVGHQVCDILRVDIGGPCWHCGDHTKWAEINFQGYLCSEECVKAKTEEYIEEAMRQ